jgi:hypothetical protein
MREGTCRPIVYDYSVKIECGELDHQNGPWLDKVADGAENGEEDKYSCCGYVCPSQERVLATYPGDRRYDKGFGALVRENREV